MTAPCRRPSGSCWNAPATAVAGDGRKGLALFEAEDLDLLFLDIFMPGMDGLETMRLAHRHRPLTPIIVISGNPVAWDSGSGPDFLAMATKLGAVTSLQKPFKPAALLAAVDTGGQEVAADVVILDDVTPRYASVSAALSSCNAGLGVALHVLQDTRTARHGTDALADATGGRLV
jgi:CheY-like chemotaxis protein